MRSNNKLLSSAFIIVFVLLAVLSMIDPVSLALETVPDEDGNALFQGESTPNNVEMIVGIDYLAFRIISITPVYLNELQVYVPYLDGAFTAEYLTDSFPTLRNNSRALSGECYVYIIGNPTLPEECSSSRTFTYTPTSNFWYVQGRFYAIKIRKGEFEDVITCPCAAPGFKIQFGFPQPMPTATPTSTPTITPTFTETPTVTHTPTWTLTPTHTLQPSATPTITLSPTATPVPTDTLSVQITDTPSPTATSTLLPNTPEVSPVPKTGGLLSTNIGAGAANQIQWSPGGNLLISIHPTGQVCLWDALNANAPVLDCETAHAGAQVLAMDWEPEASTARFATVGEGGEVYVWRVNGVTLEILDTINAPGITIGAMLDVDWNPTSAKDILLTATIGAGPQDGKFFTWDVGESAREGTNIGISSPRAITWSPNGQYIGSVEQATGAIRIVNIMGLAARPYGLTLDSFSDEGLDVAWGSNKFAALGLENGRGVVELFEDPITLFETLPGNIECTNNDPAHPVRCRFHRIAQNLLNPGELKFSPDGRLLAVSVQGGVYVFDTDAPYTLVDFYQLPESNWSVRSISWNPAGDRLAGVDERGQIYQWGVVLPARSRIQSQVSLSIQQSPVAINAVTWSPDGTRLGVVDADATLHILDAATLARLDARRNAYSASTTNETEVMSIDWNPNISPIVATGACDKTVINWDTSNISAGASDQIITNREIFHDDLVQQCINHLEFSANGSFLMSANSSSGQGAILRILDASNGTEFVYQALSHPVEDLGWSPVRPRIATVQQSGAVYVWDYNETQLTLVMSRQPNNRLRMTTAAWSSDGNLLATGGGDNEELCSAKPTIGCLISIWKVNELSLTESPDYMDSYVLQGHYASIISLSWHPTQPWLLSLDQNGLLKVWDTQTGILMEQLVMGTGTRQVVWSPQALNTFVSVNNLGNVTLWRFEP